MGKSPPPVAGWLVSGFRDWQGHRGRTLPGAAAASSIVHHHHGLTRTNPGDGGGFLSAACSCRHQMRELSSYGAWLRRFVALRRYAIS